MTPAKLGRYEILGELGKGAMGVVYLARDPLIGRQLALKTFRLGYSAEDQELELFRARFLREAQSAGILNHPNIVTIHDVIEGDGGAFFIAMEYVKGTDLKQLMQRQEQLATPFVIDIVAQIADALDYAHSKGVVHRDIKPANIILTAEKQVKITDFGIARVDASNLTVEGQLLGTPNYMAPEQVQGLEVDHRADLFSLGVVLYEMLTRHKPFYGENLTVVTHRIVNDTFTPPDRYVCTLPPGLLGILERALEKDPGRRYGHGRELAEDLRALARPPGTLISDGSVSAEVESFLPALEVPPAPPAPPGGDTLVGLPADAPAGGTPSVLPATANASSEWRGDSSVAGRSATPGTGTYVSGPSVNGPPVPPVPSPGEAADGTGDDVARSGSLRSPGQSVPSGRWPSPRRLVILIVGTVLVTGLTGLLAYRVLQGEDIVDRPGLDNELRRRYVPYLKEGHLHLEQGDPAAASEAFQRALVIVPDDPRIRRLRDQANDQIFDRGAPEQADLERRLTLAWQALDEGRYQRAIELAGEVLEIDADHREASRITDQARQNVERKRRVQERFDASSNRSSSTGAARPPTASAEPQTAETELTIEFSSEIPEGILTIYAGQKVLYKESFRFLEKTGFLRRRSRKLPGRLSSTHKLPAGEVSLKIYVYKKGMSTLSQQLTARLEADRVHILNISLLESGALEAELEAASP